MNPEIQQLVSIIGIGLGAFLIIVVTGFLCFIFPKKCDKCGKFWAFISTRVDTSKYYTTGVFVVTDLYFHRKKCLGCGYESKEKFSFKNEKLVKG